MLHVEKAGFWPGDTLWAVVWAHWPPRVHRSEVSAVGGWTLNFQEQEAPLPHRELRSQPGDPMLLNPVALSGYRQSSTLQASPRGLHLVSPQWLVTQMYSLDLIWTRVKFWVNLGHDSVGSCFSHHLAVSLLKSSKRDLDFGCGRGPEGSDLLIWLTVSFAATESFAPDRKSVV